MNKDQHSTVNLADYKVPDYLVEQIHLTFILEETDTRVTARSSIRKNPLSTSKGNTLFLNGGSKQPVSVCLDGKMISPDRMKLISGGL